jgi:hypothetical protein
MTKLFVLVINIWVRAVFVLNMLSVISFTKLVIPNLRRNISLIIESCILKWVDLTLPIDLVLYLALIDNTPPLAKLAQELFSLGRFIQSLNIMVSWYHVYELLLEPLLELLYKTVFILLLLFLFLWILGVVTTRADHLYFDFLTFCQWNYLMVSHIVFGISFDEATTIQLVIQMGRVVDKSIVTFYLCIIILVHGFFCSKYI